jgi:hypothetical protein
MRTWASAQVTRDIQGTYSLLLEHLGLTAKEKDALLSLLIEMRMAGTWISSRSESIQKGKAMNEHERSDRIAAIIGDAKLQQFLALERNLGSYHELGKIGSLLQQNGAALTDTQREALFKSLVEVRGWTKPAPPDVKRDSIEFLEHQLAQRSENERHVIELASGLLSPNQLVYLDEQYQYLSYERAKNLEWQKKKRAENPDFPLGFPVVWSD